MRKLLLFSLLSFSLSAQEAPKDLEEVHGLAVGEKAPLTTLLDENGAALDLQKLNQEETLLLVFYRGQWCPYCNRHLSALNEVIDELNGEGLRLIAISPEKPEVSLKLKEEKGLNFTFAWDENYQLSKAFDLAFLPTAATRAKYNIFLGADLAKAHANDAELLPVPASFLIDKEGIIIWRHFDPDYTERSDPKEILEIIRK